MEWSIHQLASQAGVTSRTLRHYDGIGLLCPSRTGGNGYRYYDVAAVARWQRILLLRDLGLGLSVIAEVLDRQRDEEVALRDHIELLEAERDRLGRRICALQRTLEARRSGRDPSLETLLEGFNDPYRDEIVARWGEPAFRQSNVWWHGQSMQQQVVWQRDTDALIADWIVAWKQGASPASDLAQELAARHVTWLSAIPGNPMADGDRRHTAEFVRDLGAMYAKDPRFTATYGGENGACFVRDALDEYVRRCL